MLPIFPPISLKLIRTVSESNKILPKQLLFVIKVDVIVLLLISVMRTHRKDVFMKKASLNNKQKFGILGQDLKLSCATFGQGRILCTPAISYCNHLVSR